jgi:hypothetical protein
MLDAWHWNARRLLDLHIPKRDLPRFAFSPDAANAVGELISCGLGSMKDRPGIWPTDQSGNGPVNRSSVAAT